jgi:hypothetical protein
VLQGKVFVRPGVYVDDLISATGHKILIRVRFGGSLCVATSAIGGVWRPSISRNSDSTSTSEFVPTFFGSIELLCATWNIELLKFV